MKNKLEPEALNSIIEQLEQMLGDVEKKIYRPQGTFNECNLIKIDAHNGSSFSELSRFTFPQYYLSYDNESVKISYQLEDGFYNPIELPFLNKELEDNFLQEFHLNNSRQATQKDIELIAKCTGHAAEIKRKKAYLDYLNQVPERHKKKNKNANFSSRPLTQLEYEFERKDVQQAIDYLKWLLSVVKKIKGQENESELYGMYKQRVQYFFLDREDAYFDTSFSIFNANYKPNQLYIKLLNLTVDTNYFQDIEKILSTFDRLQFLQIESHDIKTKRISFTLKSFEIQDIARLSEKKSCLGRS